GYRLRRRRRRRDLLGLVELRIACAPSHPYAAEKYDHNHGRHHEEQRDELFSAQLNLVESVLRRVVCEIGHAYALFRPVMRFISSIGNGKMIVEFFSEAISVSVC